MDVPDDQSADLRRVSAWMLGLASLPLEAATTLDPSLLWWKAQLLRRWDDQRRATAPLEVGERAQAGIGLVGGVILLAWLWRTVPAGSSFSPLLNGVMLLAVVALASVAALTAWESASGD